ncbi:uncharacterized protein [Maniola hyperantus]|uniref:uncharacterized protein n=1 Tax=Aphantopus hyperantus TaxID=2795564 RepID=UPI0037495081
MAWQNRPRPQTPATSDQRPATSDQRPATTEHHSNLSAVCRAALLMPYTVRLKLRPYVRVVNAGCGSVHNANRYVHTVPSGVHWSSSQGGVHDVIGAVAVRGGCVRGAGGASVAAAAILTLLCGADALRLAAYAPMICFYTDIIVSTCVGLWLLTSGVLSLVSCDAQRALDYVHGPLAVVNSGLVVSSAVLSYVSVIRRWDDARRPTAPTARPPRPSRFELDV